MRDAFKTTFGSVWGWLGILVGALSIINLGLTYFGVGIDPILTGIVETYQTIFHTAFDYLFFWVPMIWPEFSFSSWVKDATSIYLVFSAATVRGQNSISTIRILMDGTNGKVGSAAAYRVRERILDAMFWPRVLPRQFLRLRSLSPARVGDDNFESVQHLATLRFRAIVINMIAVPLTAFAFVAISSGMPGG